MPCTLIIHGEIGEGKTTTARNLSERAKKEGFKVKGIISIRIFNSGLIGYDVVDQSTGESRSLARLKEYVSGGGWDVFGNLLYMFNKKTIAWANQILIEAAESIDESTIIFVDEFGKLEKNKKGLYDGAKRVASSTMGIPVFLCRTDRVNDVRTLLGSERVMGRTYILEASNTKEAWRQLKVCHDQVD